MIIVSPSSPNHLELNHHDNNSNSKAHCDPASKQVRVIIGNKAMKKEDDDKSKEVILIDDGQELERVVYDDLYISADEIPKE